MATIPKEVSDYLRRIGRKGGLKGGRKGGSATTKRKSDAARANGHKGGRPKRQLCAGCDGELTQADRQAGECTQCGKGIK